MPAATAVKSHPLMLMEHRPEWAGEYRHLTKKPRNKLNGLTVFESPQGLLEMENHMRHETFTYRWHRSEGGFDCYCMIDLDLKLDPENLDVKAISACFCSQASEHSKEGVFRFGLLNNCEYLAWIGQQFLIQHAANRFNLADDLQEQVRNAFNVPAAA